MELFHANQQWSTRPKDQRFASLNDLHDATKAYASTAVEKTDAQWSSLRVEAVDGNVHLVGRGGIPANLTHWSFGQLANRIGAPAGYLRELPATLAAQNLNHGLAKRVADGGNETVNLLFHQNGSIMLRALTSERYTRIWNWEVTERLIDLQGKGWIAAMPDVRANLDPEGPRPALYASDHDMFAFLCHSDRTIAEPGNAQGLKRGLIAMNSEVGAGKIRVLRFLYREMCGNHIIWGAEDVIEMAASHVGNVRGKFASWNVEIQRYLDSSPIELEQKIVRAQATRIAATKDALLDAVFGKRSIALSRKAIEAGFEACIPDVDGDPLTPWGLTQGLTRYSQTEPFADKRTEIDRAAGRILDAF